MNRVIQNTIAAAIFIVPMSSLIVVHDTIVWYPQLLAIILLGFFLISAFLYSFNRPLAFLAFYCALSYIFVCHQHPKALIAVVLMYSGLLLAAFTSKINRRATLYCCIIVFACLQVALAVEQNFGSDPFFVNHTTGLPNEVVGFVGSKNQLGLYYGTILPLLFFTYPALAIIGITGLWLSHCYSAAIGGFIGLSLYLFLIKSHLALPLVLSGLVIMVFFLYHDRIDRELLRERAGIIHLTIKQSIQGKAKQQLKENVQRVATWNPWFGAGVSGFMAISPSTQGSVIFEGFRHRYEHAHNDLVESLFELGYIGFSLVVLAILNTIKAFIMVWRKSTEICMVFCCLVAQGISSLGVYSIHAPSSFFLFCLMLGLFWGIYNEIKGEGTTYTEAT